MRAVKTLVAGVVAAAVLVIQPAAGDALAEERTIVSFVDGTSAGQQVAALQAAGVAEADQIRRLPDIGQAVVRTGAAQRIRLAGRPEVASLVADRQVELAAAPDDEFFAGQQSLADMSVPAAWDQVLPGGFQPAGPFDGAPIAVIDSGIDPDHPEFAGADGTVFDQKVPICVHYPPNILFNPVDCHSGANDDISHGTHVAGLAAAIADDTVGIAGVSPTSPIHSYKACQSRLCWIGDLQAGIVDAANDGASVINLSLGGFVPLPTWDDAVDYALDHDVVVVAAAGNLGNSGYSYPASFNGVVSVGALNTGTGNRASFSQFNDRVDLAAPGTGILGPVAPPAADGQSGAYAGYSGTSMATPHVAGVAALIRTRHPDWTASQVRGALYGTATDVGAAGRDDETGFGRVNALAALSHAPAADGDLDDDGRPDDLDGDPADPTRFTLRRWAGTATASDVTVAVVWVNVFDLLQAGFVRVSTPDRFVLATLDATKATASSIRTGHLETDAFQLGGAGIGTRPLEILATDDPSGDRLRVVVDGVVLVDGPVTGGGFEIRGH